MSEVISIYKRSEYICTQSKILQILTKLQQDLKIYIQFAKLKFTYSSELCLITVYIKNYPYMEWGTGIDKVLQTD